MNEKIKILMTTTNLGLNGISGVIMNYCNKLDMNKFNVTIFAGSPIDDNYYNACQEKGIHVVELPPRKPSTFRYYFHMIKNIKKNEFDVLHVHGNSSAMIIELLIAKLKGIKVRIAHCHNAKCSNPIVNTIFSYFFKNNYTYGFACSTEAGKWVFRDDNFSVLPNGFEVSKFKFDSKKRDEVRKKLNLENDFVIGHIGRFNSQKNQKYLVDVLKKISTIDNNVKLLFVGNGPDFLDVKNYVKEINLDDKVVFYGETTNPSELYSAMDIFAFPSRYEGLGIVLLEAQINGLDCIVSDNVPKECMISDNVFFESINECSIEKWADFILSKRKKSVRKKIDINDKKIQYYNINKNVSVLEKIYIDHVRNIKRGNF